MKTLKDMFTYEVYQDDGSVVVWRKEIELKESAIEDIKELDNKEQGLHVQGQIDYIKWKFNLTDEDLK